MSDIKYPMQLSKQVGHKPQSKSAINEDLDRLVNVFQLRSSSGMQWHGIEPLTQVYVGNSVVSVGILEIFTEFSMGTFRICLH